jgi:choice-of-anchor B domain-containing protein
MHSPNTMRFSVLLCAAGLAAAAGTTPAQAQLQSSDWRKLADPIDLVPAEPVFGPLTPQDGEIAGFPASNVTLMAWLPLTEFPNNQHSGNDCWGYTSPSGREYAFYGMQSGFSVLDVTDPTNPVQLGFVPGNNSVWRDIKVIGDYAYGVSEGGLGIQVIDLSQADSGSVTHVRNKMQNGHTSTHNIAANPDSGYLYLCGANIGNGGLVAVSTADPENPTIVGAWTGRYVHDAQIVTYDSGPYAGREIAYCCVAGSGVNVIDVTDKGNMYRIGSFAYPGTHYCHQAWLSEDRQYLFTNDEMDEGTSFAVTTTHVLDVSNPAAPYEVTTFTSGSASTDHNLYVVGDRAFEANYMSGLRVFDVSNPLGAQEVAYLDTSPDRDQVGYHGAWSNYPFFASGTILVSDIERGLFILRLGEDGLAFSFPDGLPEQLSPGAPTQVRAVIDGDGATLDPGSVELVLGTADGQSVTAMSPDGAGGFVADLPAGQCLEEYEYHFRAKDTAGRSYVEPFNAPIIGGFEAQVATGTEVAFADDFQSDMAWLADNSRATSGGWARVQPTGGNAVEPASDADGSGLAFLTGAIPGESLEGGPITLTSPALDLAGRDFAQVHFSLWYDVDGIAAPPMEVELSDDNGVTWTLVESFPREAAWRSRDVRVADFVQPTGQVRLRFTASNVLGIATVEAGVDDIRVTSPLCDACTADYNGDGELTTQDFLAYLNDFTGSTNIGEPDLNGDGTVNTQDFLLFLNLYAAGCD